MRYSDEDLDRLFRATRPPGRKPDAPLDAKAMAIRERIIRGKPHRSLRPRLLWASLTVATAVAAIVLVSVLTPGQSAVAHTPPPLIYSAAAPLDEVIDVAERSLEDEPDVAQASTVNSVTWGWNVDMGSKDVEDLPQNITFEWSIESGSTTTVVAGDSYWDEGERPADIEPSPYMPGDLIDRVVTPPENFILDSRVATLEGSSKEDLTAALEVFGATPESSSGELVAAMTRVLGYWTLDDAQHATLLQILEDAGDLTVRGTTTDRLGREVVGVQVSQVIPERQETVFISTETGRIVGMESELVKPLDGLPLGVILYTLWDVGSDASHAR